MEPLKVNAKYLIHTSKGTIIIQYWKFKSAQIYELIIVFEMPHLGWKFTKCLFHYHGLSHTKARIINYSTIYTMFEYSSMP